MFKMFNKLVSGSFRSGPEKLTIDSLYCDRMNLIGMALVTVLKEIALIYIGLR